MGRKLRIFEPDSYIAYRFDQELGYRDSADREWRFVPIEDLRESTSRFRRQVVHLENLAPSSMSVPSLRLEPGPDEGEVRFSSTSPLSIHPYGDTSSRMVGREVDLRDGSVVRAGSLLVAPLYAEQVESTQDGLLTLPSIGRGGVSNDSDESEDEDRGSRRWALGLWGAIWSLGFIASAAAGVAACVAFYHPYYSHAASLPTITFFLLGLFWFWLVVTGMPIHRIVSDWVQAPTLDPDDYGKLSRRKRALVLGVWYSLWIGAFVAVAVQFLIEAHYFYTYDLLDSFVTLLNGLIPRWVLILLLGTPVHFVVSFFVKRMRESLSQPVTT